MSLFSELKNRKVFATAAIYVPVAWLTAEICIELFDRFDAPQWAGDVVAVLFILGFPVTLLLSWLFDATRDGLKRASPGTPLGIIVLLASGLFLSASAYVSYQVFSGRISEISVAILPLKTNGQQSAAQSYGSGIADNLRSSLQQIPIFRVPALTSSEAVVKAGLDVAGIASKLDVQYVMEGTLEMAGKTLNISVSLIDSGGNVQWSDRFQGAIRDIFELQNELVRAVALQLGVHESDADLQRTIRKPAPTQDMEAHRLYLQGKYGGFDTSGSADESGALVALKAARDRDPGYAAVYPAIAFKYAARCWGLDDRRNPDCELAINYANQGLQIEPDLAEALATLALVHSIRYEYHEAQAAIDTLLVLPGHTVRSSSLPWAYMNLGRLQETWDSSKEFYQNDPLNDIAVLNMALYAWSLKRDNDLAEYYDRIFIEMTGSSAFSAFPAARAHRVDQITATAELREDLPNWDVSPDFAEIQVRPYYEPSSRQIVLADLERFHERDDIREAWYWESLITLHETDRAISMAFDQFDQDVLNPVMFWTPGLGRMELRSHPRFIELIEYIELASYWDSVGWPPFCELRETVYFCGLDYKVE